MTKKELFLKTMGLLYDFQDQADGDEVNFSEFVGFLNAYVNRSSKSSSIRQIDDGTEEQWLEEQSNEESDVAVLLSFLSKYLKAYTKKALEASKISTPEEFGSLVTLMRYESLTKTELILKQAIEKPSGVEIIKRLIKMELIYEFPDETDRRSVRVATTEAGKATIRAVLPKMLEVSTLVKGNLSSSELRTLIYILKKLDDFHFNIFDNGLQKSLSISEIIERNRD